jgi:hypothetical protein
MDTLEKIYEIAKSEKKNLTQRALKKVNGNINEDAHAGRDIKCTHIYGDADTGRDIITRERQ